MNHLPREIEALAQRLAAAQQISVEEAIRQALEEKARAAGLEPIQRPRRMSVDEMLAVGAEIAAMPLLDQRSPSEIMDELDTP
jgi:antitoxin VapB